MTEDRGSNRIPEAWIGRGITVARTNATEAELVSLEDVNAWGVTCGYTEAEVQEPVFIPWSSVSWMRLTVPVEVEDQPEDEE